MVLGRASGSVVDSVKRFRALSWREFKLLVNQKVIGDLSGDNSRNLLRHLAKCAYCTMTLLGSHYYHHVIMTEHFSSSVGQRQDWKGLRGEQELRRRDNSLQLAACLNTSARMRRNEINWPETESTHQRYQGSQVPLRQREWGKGKISQMSHLCKYFFLLSHCKCYTSLICSSNPLCLKIVMRCENHHAGRKLTSWERLFYKSNHWRDSNWTWDPNWLLCGRVTSDTSLGRQRLTGRPSAKTLCSSGAGGGTRRKLPGRPTETSFSVASNDYELHLWTLGLGLVFILMLLGQLKTWAPASGNLASFGWCDLDS